MTAAAYPPRRILCIHHCLFPHTSLPFLLPFRSGHSLTVFVSWYSYDLSFFTLCSSFAVDAVKAGVGGCCLSLAFSCLALTAM